MPYTFSGVFNQLFDRMKISIITVVYNGVRFLEGTIQSIAVQTSKDYEYIIIDGASTDGTLEIIKKYENDIDNWTSEPDKGLYDAMNKGLKLATGNFVWFINAGDKIFDSTTVEKIISIANSTNPDLLYGETLIIGENDSEIGMRRQPIPKKLNWKSLQFGMVVCHQSFIPKREIAPMYDLTYSCSSDIDWVIKCLKNANNIINTELILSRFLDGGRSKKTIIPSLKERYAIMVKNYGVVSTLINHLWIALRFFIFYFRNRRF